MSATKEYTEEEKHLHHIEGGYKATLSNPKSSEEAKKHAQEQLDKIAKGEKPEEGSHSHSHSSESSDGKNIGNVIGGYKGTLSNPNTSEEAKKHAREELKKLGVSEDEYTEGDEKKGLKRSSETEVTSSPKKQKELTEDEKHQHHIEGGYKATLSNPNSSEEAKKHAQEMLDKIAKGEKVDAANPAQQKYSEEEKHLHSIEGGYKATLSNPNSSEEAKKHAQEQLDKIAKGEKVEAANPAQKEYSEEEKHLHHIEGGYKATLSNPKSSEEAKKHAQEQLDKIAKGEKPEEGARSESGEDKNIGNVIGGYKGTLSNPNTSEEAKKHAREELKKLGVSEDEYNNDDKKESSEKETSGNGKQGFASMPKDKVKEIASKGGRTAHAGEEPAPLKNQ